MKTIKLTPENVIQYIGYEIIFKNEKFILQNKDIKNKLENFGFILNNSEWIKLLD